MCGGFTCSKNALIALNILYVVVACILIYVGARPISVIFTGLPLVGGIIACGVFLMLVSMLGLVGAVKHHQVMLFFYMVILFMLFLVQFSVACACLAVNSDQQDMIAQQGWNKFDLAAKNRVQLEYSCCGYSRQVTTSNSTTTLPPIIDDCGEVNKICCSNALNNPDCTCPPCHEKLKASLDYYFKLCGGIGLFFSFTEVFAVWVARRYRNQPDPNYKEPHAVFPRADYLY